MFVKKIVTFFLLEMIVVAAVSSKTKTSESELNDDYSYQKLLLLNATLTGMKRATKYGPRYDPDSENTYHLFTRNNPIVSQPLVMNNDATLRSSTYFPSRRTIILIHGWLDTIISDFCRILVPAFLEADDVNVITVDWSRGAGVITYPIAVRNTPLSGESVSRFILWLTGVSGSALNDFHLVGHDLGAHQAGVVGRHLGGQVAYITALDPSFSGWVPNANTFRSTDGIYTEAIHTNVGILGYLSELGKVDFYPNGGKDMPGCTNPECDHDRSFYYFAESIKSGGFTGTRCSSYSAAMSGECSTVDRIVMGGLVPKTGESGVFFLRTNSFPPYSRE